MVYISQNVIIFFSGNARKELQGRELHMNSYSNTFQKNIRIVIKTLTVLICPKIT